MAEVRESVVKAVRPLDKGIVLNVPPQGMADGAFRDLKNLFVEPYGLVRRAPYQNVVGGTTVDFPPIQAIYTLWGTDGTQITCVIDQKYLYTMTGNTLTPVYNLFTDAVNTVSTSGTTVTGVGTTWSTGDDEILAGDVIVLDPDESGDGAEAIEIATVTDNTHLALASTPAGTYGAGSDYEIRRTFHALPNKIVDGTVAENKLILADGTRFLYAFDGTTLEDYNTDQEEVPLIVTYFHDRLWLARIEEDGSTYVQRIRHSNLGVGNMDTIEASSYQDLPYSKGQAMQIVPLHDVLVFYFEDAIYTGTPTSMPTQPLWFDPVETGGIGLVGMQAVTRVPGGHIFVGTDNIYYFDGKSYPQAIGTPILKESIEKCSRMDQIRVGYDTTNSRVIVSFPASGSQFNKIWVFSLKSKAWSYLDIQGYCLATTAVIDIESWDSIAINWSGGGTADVWSSYSQGELRGNQIYFTNAGTIYKVMDSGTLDTGTTSIGVTIETGDFDFDEVDLNKVATRFNLKLEDTASSAMSFVVYGSINRGHTWKTLGTLRIAAGDDEGKVDFRLLGSIIRFKVVGSNAVEPYVVSEYSFKIHPRGMEVPGRLT